MIKSCWTLTNSIASLRRQCNSIALALGLEATPKIASVKKPWKWLPFSWQRYANIMYNCDNTLLSPPWPDLVIASGKNVIPIALTIKRLSRNQTQLIYVQTPRRACKQFDLIIAPTHDRCTGDNVIETLGAPHDLTLESLSTATNQWRQRLSHHNSPFLSILIGGTHKGYSLTASRTAQLASQIEKVAATYPGTVLITTSRRTGHENLQYLLHRFKAKKNIWLYDGHGKNPYLGLLGLATTIMVTNDSVNMISEACFTGKPVYILNLPGSSLRKKTHRFIETCKRKGYVRDYLEEIEGWTYTPLREAERIGPLIHAKLKLLNG